MLHVPQRSRPDRKQKTESKRRPERLLPFKFPAHSAYPCCRRTDMHTLNCRYG